MTLAVAPSQPAEQEHLEYDSDFIDGCLKRWEELAALAEHVRSPSAFEVARPAPTRGRHRSSSVIEIKADLERAHAQLHRAGLNWRVIDERKRGTGSLGNIARAIGIRKDDVCGAYRSALTIMVEYLNG